MVRERRTAEGGRRDNERVEVRWKGRDLYKEESERDGERVGGGGDEEDE